MEGENFPYFFTQSPFPSSVTSFENSSVRSILDQSMQNAPTQFPQHSENHQINFPSLFSASGSVDRNSNTDVSRNSIIGEGNDAVGRNKAKYGKKRKHNIPPRVAFHTRSDEDILDDGFKWRKYGQKTVKHNVHPRSYYRCTQHTCTVKKQIQRLSKDTSIVETTYEGIHNHPCEKLMETLGPLLKQLQFLSGF